MAEKKTIELGGKDERVSKIFLDRMWSLDAIITGTGPPDGMDEPLPPVIEEAASS